MIRSISKLSDVRETDNIAASFNYIVGRLAYAFDHDLTTQDRSPNRGSFPNVERVEILVGHDPLVRGLPRGDMNCGDRVSIRGLREPGTELHTVILPDEASGAGAISGRSTYDDPSHGTTASSTTPQTATESSAGARSHDGRLVGIGRRLELLCATVSGLADIWT